MNSIVKYLEREPCLNCKIDLDGNLVHCEIHQALYNEALALIKDLSAKPTYAQKQELDRQREADKAAMKQSHDWFASRTFVDPGRTRMMPWASHCKKCGILMTVFKVKPSYCTVKKNV